MELQTRPGTLSQTSPHPVSTAETSRHGDSQIGCSVVSIGNECKVGMGRPLTCGASMLPETYPFCVISTSG
ncbi:hypothetical protein F2Q68_00033141 [Brassica cretica]|uniref:Uncharacterized protein n=1 Tax=Brassica cretica TaxID=69181 RepID=A0A8S9GJH0_BRACR|nr:hypothetical protein F2Q68_00033141 [Brassica cretica]